MKFRLFAAALLLLAMASCTSPRERFTVRGVVTDSLATVPGSIVYLLGPDGPVDSTFAKHGTFSFSGEQDPTKQFVVMLRFPGRDLYDDSFMAAFVPDSKLIGIDLDYPATVTGSPLTDAINAYNEKVMNLYYEHETDIGSFAMNGEQEVADSIYRAQIQKIVDLSRETYLANTDNALGLQAFSLLVSELGREELEELAAAGGEHIRNNEQLKALIEGKEE